MMFAKVIAVYSETRAKLLKCIGKISSLMLELAMYTVNHVLYRLNLYIYVHEVKFLNTPLYLSKHLKILSWLVLLLTYWPVVLR